MPSITNLAEGFESLALTLLPSPRQNAEAILGEYGPRLASFGFVVPPEQERPPMRKGLLQLEAALAELAQETGRGPMGLSLNLAKSEVTRMVAILSAQIIGLPDGIEVPLSHSAIIVAGHLRRALEGGAAVGSG